MTSDLTPDLPPASLPASPQPRPPRSALRRWLIRLVWLLVLAALAAGGAWIVLHPRDKSAAKPTRSAAPVATATARAGDMPILLNALGTVTPLATVTVKTQIPGQLIQVAFTEGQMVQAGDLLAQIDPRPHELQLAQYQGQLQRDQALLKEARQNQERYRTLVAQDSIAKQQLTTQESLVQQYLGAIAVDQALVNSAKLNLTYGRVTAPIDGRIGLRPVDPGNYVQTSDPNGLAVITQLRPISVLFSLPEDTLPAVQQALRAGAPPPVEAFDRSRTKKLAVGALATIDNQIDPATGTVKLRAQFDNADESLFPNQFVTIQLRVDTLRAATLVPTAAILRGAPGTFVYLIKADETVTARPVTLGPSTGETTAVAAGLAPGDVVVIDGADKLREGARVTRAAPREPGAPGTNPGAAPPATPTPTPPREKHGDKHRGEGEPREKRRQP